MICIIKLYSYCAFLTSLTPLTWNHLRDFSFMSSKKVFTLHLKSDLLCMNIVPFFKTLTTFEASETRETNRPYG